MEIFTELIASIRERVRSSFTLAFILAWCYCHWLLLVDMIVYLPRDKTVVLLIQNYIEQHNGWCGMILIPVGYAFLGYSLFLIFSLITVSLRHFYNETVLPFVLEKIKEGSMATRERLNEEVRLRKLVEQKNTELEEINKNSRDQVNRLEEQRSALVSVDNNKTFQLNTLKEDLEKVKGMLNKGISGYFSKTYELRYTYLQSIDGDDETGSIQFCFDESNRMIELSGATKRFIGDTRILDYKPDHAVNFIAHTMEHKNGSIMVRLFELHKQTASWDGQMYHFFNDHNNSTKSWSRLANVSIRVVG